MSILVTGGSGYIGKYLCKELVSQGYDVRVLSRRQPPAQPGVSVVAGDLLDGASLPPAVQGCSAVIHLAALTHSSDSRLYDRVNVDGTRNLLAASQQEGVGRFVYMSTRCATTNAGAYGQSKLAAEQLVREQSVPWVTLRPAEVYADESDGAIASIRRQVVNGPLVLLPGDGGHLLAPVHVEDVALATVAAVDVAAAIGRCYTLAGPQELTIDQVVDAIESAVGRRRPRLHVPFALIKLAALCLSPLSRPPVVRDQVPRLQCKKSADISSAVDDLGYCPRSFEDALKA